MALVLEEQNLVREKGIADCFKVDIFNRQTAGLGGLVPYLHGLTSEMFDVYTRHHRSEINSAALAVSDRLNGDVLTRGNGHIKDLA
jgi:hypothetical protein